MSRPLMVSVLSALILFILLSLSFVYVFPPETWAELWDKTVMGVPFLLFVSVVSLLIGIASGLVLDFVWRKQRQVVMQALEQIEHGEMGNFGGKSRHRNFRTFGGKSRSCKRNGSSKRNVFKN